MCLFTSAVGWRYVSKTNVDCMVDGDIFSLRSDFTKHENCFNWCNQMESCGAFTLYRDTCYFKNLTCSNKLVAAEVTELLYMKQGSQVI